MVPRSAVRTIACVCTLLLVTACSGDDDRDDARRRRDTNSVDSSTRACTLRATTVAAQAVLRCAEPSVAFIETSIATGTGVVIAYDDERYVLTNHHVVDPYAGATVTVGREPSTVLPLVGSDVAADIALLGPLARDAPPLRFYEGEIERGESVFLVGYPGEAPEDDHDVTISSGIVSRLRHLDEWGMTYVQTDAAIAGGQSGGPLFDARGRLIGISGLSFAEEFALALSAANVSETVERILAAGGDDVLLVPVGVPADGGAGSGDVHIDNATDTQVLHLPPADEARSWTLSVVGGDSTVAIELIDASRGDLLGMNAAAGSLFDQVDELLASAADDLPPEFDFDFGDDFVPDEHLVSETTPGTLTLDVEPDQAVDVMLSVPLTAAPVDVSWTSDLELWPRSRPVVLHELGLGETVDEVLSAFDTSVDFVVELEADEDVEIWARSPHGDVFVEVLPPGVVLDALAAHDPTVVGIEEFDDSGEGLYGLDVHEAFTPETSGSYRFRVSAYDQIATAFRFSVERT